MEVVETTPDEHLASFTDEDIRSTMAALDAVIVAAMPGRRRVLWEGVMWGGTAQSIIGYGDMVQPRPRGDDVEWFVVGLARQKSYFSLYVNAVDDGTYIGQTYAERLGRVRVGAASLGFNHLSDIDMDVLAEMLKRAHETAAPDR